MAFGMTINVYSAIGLMMLFGIVKEELDLPVDHPHAARSGDSTARLSIVATMSHCAIPDDDHRDRCGHDSDRPGSRRLRHGSRASMAITILGGQVLCLV